MKFAQCSKRRFIVQTILLVLNLQQWRAFIWMRSDSAEAALYCGPAAMTLKILLFLPRNL